MTYEKPVDFYKLLACNLIRNLYFFYLILAEHAQSLCKTVNRWHCLSFAGK